MSGGTLYLIDGNSILYRSFYAIQRLATSQGFPTNAIYGFIATLRKLLDEAKPELLGIVFDAPGAKMREEIFEGYKAQRKPMPEDLVKQIPKLKEVLRAFRIPLYENARYEADDVLGSLAARASALKIKTVLSRPTRTSSSSWMRTLRSITRPRTSAWTRPWSRNFSGSSRPRWSTS